MPKDSNGNETIYIGFPFLTDMDTFVTNELTSRAADRIRAITPFVKATPGFISNQDNYNDRIVLQGIQGNLGENQAAYKFTDLYRPDKSMRPLAGIKSVNIDFKNKYGSIRKATISWICHSTDDLELLSQYFLNPGHTILLEWGWSKAVNEVFDIDSKIDLATYLPEVRKKIKRSDGNYDAMLGIIINYNWSLNRDGGFECTTEILSSGILMEGITIPEQKTVEPSKDGTIQQVVSTLRSALISTFYNRIKNDYELYKNVSEDSDYFIYAKDSSKIDEYNSLIQVDAKGDTNKENAEKLRTNIINTPIYLSWGYIEDAFINPHIKFENYSGRQVLAFNDVGVKIGHHSALRSADLGICIIPERNSGTITASDADSNKTCEIDKFHFDKSEFGTNKSIDGLKFGYIRRILINAEFFRQTMLNSVTLNDGIASVFGKINDACGSFWEFILINREFSYDESEQSTTSAQSNNTQTTNTYGGLLVSPRTNSNTGDSTTSNAIVLNPTHAIYNYSVVDINYADRVTELKPYIFRTRSFIANGQRTTSVVKNVNLQSKLSNAAALNVFYSANRGDSTIQGLPNSTVYHSLYKTNIKIKENTEKVQQSPTTSQESPEKFDVYASGPYITPQPEEPEKDTNEEASAIAKDSGFNGSELLADQSSYPVELKVYLPLYSYGYNFVRKDSKGNPRGLSGREGMKIAILENGGSQETEKSVKSNSAIIPITCEIELEGISGIRIGDIFSIDSLPRIYKERGVFQCIGLTHSITKDSWVTKVNGGYRINRNKDEMSSSNNKSDDEFFIPTTETITRTSNTSIKRGAVDPPADLIDAMRKYGIVQPLEKAHFLSQCAHESGGFRLTEELADGQAYEGRKALGNTQPGDGKRFKGRGYIQLTGRNNYTAYNKYLKSKGISDDVISNPSLVKTKYAADSSCYWWKYIGKVTFKAMQGDTPKNVFTVSARVNGINKTTGRPNGLEDRQQRFNGYWDKLKNNNSLYA